jgi:O-antigen/teichoic acid export membrane protein
MIKKELKHLVSFLNKWTDLDILYYFKGGAVLFSTQFLIILSYFFLNVVFAHLATKELFGQFQFIISIIGLLSVLSLPGANTAVALGVSQKKDGTLLQGVKLKLKWSLLAIVGIIIASAYFYFKREPSYETVWSALLGVIVFIPIIYALDLAHAFFVGKKKFEWSCAFQLISEVAGPLAVLSLLFFTKNLFVLTATYFAFRAVAYVSAFVFARRRMENKTTESDFNSYSFHLTVINLIPEIKMFFDKLIVTFFLGFAATAVYTIGAAMAEQLYAVSKTIGMLIFPKLSVQGKEVMYAEVKRRTGKMALFFIVIAGLAALLAPILIPLFFSAQYNSAIILAQLLLLVSVPRAVAFVLTRVQEAQKQKKKLYVINVLYSAVEIVSLLVMIPLYGMYGLVVAKGLSNVVYVVAAWKSLR